MRNLVHNVTVQQLREWLGTKLKEVPEEIDIFAEAAVYRLRTLIGNFRLAKYRGRRPPLRHKCLSLILDKIPERPRPTGPEPEPLDDPADLADGAGDTVGDDSSDDDVEILEPVSAPDDEVELVEPELDTTVVVQPDEELDGFMTSIFNTHPRTKH